MIDATKHNELELTAQSDLIVRVLGKRDRYNQAIGNYMASLGTDISRTTMRDRLRIALRLLYGRDVDVVTYPWESMNYESVSMLKMKATDHYGTSGGSINLTLSAVKGVCREAFKARMMSADDWMRIQLVKGSKNRKAPRGHAVEIVDQVHVDRHLKRMSQCEDLHEYWRHLYIRNRAINSVMFNGGPRVSELVKVDTEHYLSDPLQILFKGKGGKERVVRLSRKTACGDSTAEVIAAWLAVRGNHPGPLFTSLREPRAERLGLGRRLGPAAIAAMLRTVAREASVPKFAPHDTRRTYISDLIKAENIETASVAAGHSDISTTMLYWKAIQRERAMVSGAKSLARYRDEERAKLDAGHDEHDDDAAE